MTDADAHYRRVLMTQSRVFKRRGDSFYHTLVQWARRAGRARQKPIPDEPEQMVLL